MPVLLLPQPVAPARRCVGLPLLPGPGRWLALALALALEGPALGVPAPPTARVTATTTTTTTTTTTAPTATAAAIPANLLTVTSWWMSALPSATVAFGTLEWAGCCSTKRRCTGSQTLRRRRTPRWHTPCPLCRRWDPAFGAAWCGLTRRPC